MNSNRRLEQLVEALIHVIGRVAMSEDRVREIVATGDKQVEAFNLFDGSRTQTQVAQEVGLDQGNLSRAASRWVENGVAFWVGEGDEERLLHIFPIPVTKRKATKPTRRR